MNKEGKTQTASITSSPIILPTKKHKTQTTITTTAIPKIEEEDEEIVPQTATTAENKLKKEDSKNQSNGRASIIENLDVKGSSNSNASTTSIIPDPTSAENVDKSNETFRGMEDNQSTTRPQPKIHARVIRGEAFDLQFIDIPKENTFAEVFNAFEVNLTYKDLHKRFALTSDYEPYIVYKTPYVVQGFADNTHIINNPFSDVVKKTEDMFPIGTLFTEVALNEKFFGKHGVTLDRGVPILQNMIVQLGIGQGSQESSEVTAGLIMCLFMIMNDNRIAYTDKLNIPIVGTIEQRISEFLSNKYLPDIAPHPMLLLGITDIPWLNIWLREHVESEKFKYIIGNVFKTRMNTILRVKEIEQYALNIDSYSATIMNNNLKSIIESKAVVGDVISGFQAHAYSLSHINSPPLAQPRLDLQFNRDHAIRLLMYSSAMFDKFELLLLRINVDYIHKADLFNMAASHSFYPQSLVTSQDAKTFLLVAHSYIRKADVDTARLAIAREMTPVTHVRRLVTIDRSYSSPGSVLLIFEYVIFCWLFPNSFNQVKGEIQNALLGFFAAWYPEETLAFNTSYGTTYTINATGQFQFSRRIEYWLHDWILTNRHPSLFCGKPFKSCPNISNLMSYFQPLGALVQDTKAIAAKFPRSSKDPHHYLPSELQTQTVSNNLRLRFNMLTKDLTQRARNHSSLIPSSGEKTHISSFFTHLSDRFQFISRAVTEHFPLAYSAMANFATNYSSSFNGNFATSTLTNHCIVSSENFIQPTIGSINDTSLVYVNTGIIWTFLGQLEYPYLEQLGIGHSTESIGINIMIPLPQDSYLASMNLLTNLETMTTPSAYLNYLFSDSGVCAVHSVFWNKEDNDINVILNQDFVLQVASFIDSHGLSSVLPINQHSTIADLTTSIGNGALFFGVTFDSNLTFELLRFFSIRPVFLIFVRPIKDVLRRIVLLPDEQPINVNDITDTVEDRKISDIAGDLGDDIGDLNIDALKRLIPDLTSRQKMAILEKLGVASESDQTGYARETLQFLGTITRDVLFKNPQIRRLDQNFSIQQFDPVYDIDAFRNSRHFLTDAQLERLHIGAELLFKRSMFRIYKGLRLAWTPTPQLDPEALPGVTGLTVVILERDTFIQINYEKDRVLAYNHLNADGTRRVYPSFEGRPRIYLKVKNQVVDDLVVNQILGSVSRSGWVVDVLEVFYTAAVVQSINDASQLTMTNILQAPKGKLLHLQLVDDSLRFRAKEGSRPTMTQMTRTIFPLMQITRGRSVRGLIYGDGDEVPARSHGPNKDECDTGTLSPAGELLYTDGRLKRSTDQLSMTNVLQLYTNKIEFVDNIQLNIFNENFVSAPKTLY